MTLIAERGEPKLVAVLSYLQSLGLHGEVIGHAVRSATPGTR